MSRLSLALAVLLLVACGGPNSSTATTPAPTVAPLSAAPTTVAPTPATAAPAAQATSVPAAAAAPTPADPGSAPGATMLQIDPSVSKASYHAHEQLVGRSLPSEAVGTTPVVSGAIALDPQGNIASDQSQVQVDLSKLQSDQDRRDNFIKGQTLQTSRYPNATFVARQVQGLPSPLPNDGQLDFQLLGDLTVHGVTKPVTWDVSAQFTSANVTGDATTSVNISDFGMTPPKAGPVLSIEDGLTLELAFSANRSG